MAHEHPVLVDRDVLVRNDIGQGSAASDHGSLHQNAVAHPGALLDDNAPGDDGVFHLALDEAAVRHQGVDRAGVWTVVGGGVGAVLGADGPVGIEKLIPDGGLQQIHGALEVAADRLEAGHIALVDIGHQLQGLEPGLEDAAAEVHDVVGGAVVHHVQQQLFGQDIDLKALQSAAGGDGMDGQVGHPAGIIHLHILGEAGRALQAGGADHGHIGAAV